MAAITASSIIRENLGSLNLLICKMASVDTGDTYATHHSGIAAHWAQHLTGAGTTGSGIGIGTSDNGSGTITFLCPLSDNAVNLFLLVRD